MAILSHPAFGPRTSIAYITVGTLLDVWTAVWYFTLVRPEGGPHQTYTWFWLSGLFLTGLVLIVIGALLGPIGQAARRAELPPSEALPAEAKAEQAAAANPHPAVPAAAGVAPLAPPTAPAGAVPAAVPGQPAYYTGS